MELVYLWVEEYKNIRNQGFNFNSNSLFDNDLKITAIVGENGSGKSGLVESLMMCLLNNKREKFKYKFYLIFKDSIKEYIYFTPNWELSDELKIKKLYINCESIKLETFNPFILHYNYAIDNFSSNFQEAILHNDIYDYEKNDLNIFSQPNKLRNEMHIEKINKENLKNMVNVYSFILDNNLNISKLKYVQDLSYRIANSFGRGSNVDFTPDTFKLEFNYVNYISSFHDLEIRKSIDAYCKKQESTSEISTLKKFTVIFLIFRLYELAYYQEIKRIDISENFINKVLQELKEIEVQTRAKILNKERDSESVIFNQEVIDDFINKFEYTFYKELLKEEIKQKLPDIFNTAWYIDYIDSNSKQTTDLFKNRNEFDKKILIELLQYLPSFIEFEFWNNKRISYKDLSYGEKTINRFFYNLFYHINHFSKGAYKNFFIILDEIEIGLHPDWQKKFLSFCINIVKILEIFFEIRIHIILATHSPFILSDLPKENVIFLEKDKESGLCKNVSEHTKLKTFGANIHTLLSDGFFMSDGLMGEFAKKTIQDVITYLNDKSNPIQNMNKQKAWQTIQLIGEPFLKHKLEEKYNEKFLTQEEQKQNKIKQLENELKRLKDDNTQS